MLLSVVPDSQTMRDVKRADGALQFKKRIVEGLHKDTKLVTVPITAVVDYDIENMEINLQTSYNFMAELSR